MVFPFKYSINLKSTSILRLLHVPLSSSNVSGKPQSVNPHGLCLHSGSIIILSAAASHLLILTFCIFKWKISRKPRLFDWYPFLGDKKPDSLISLSGPPLTFAAEAAAWRWALPSLMHQTGAQQAKRWNHFNINFRHGSSSSTNTDTSFFALLI